MVLSFIDRDSCGGWWFIYKLKKIIGSKQCFPLVLPRLVVGGGEFQWDLGGGVDGDKLVIIV